MKYTFQIQIRLISSVNQLVKFDIYNKKTTTLSTTPSKQNVNNRRKPHNMRLLQPNDSPN